MIKSIINLTIYTDGSSKPYGDMKFGGWSFIVSENGSQIHYESGSEYGATNQRMELIAAINACKWAAQRRKDNQDVEIYSDSAYLINCYQQGWWIKWQANGWITSKGESVLNQELWWELIPFFKNPNFLFMKVKGHSTNYFNNKCDELAQREADLLRLNWRGINNE